MPNKYVYKYGQPWQFHPQLFCRIFSLLIILHIACLSICIPIKNYDFCSRYKLQFFMQVCIIEYLFGTSQVNEYRASKRKL